MTPRTSPPPGLNVRVGSLTPNNSSLKLSHFLANTSARGAASAARASQLPPTGSLPITQQVWDWRKIEYMAGIKAVLMQGARGHCLGTSASPHTFPSPYHNCTSIGKRCIFASSWLRGRSCSGPGLGPGEGLTPARDQVRELISTQKKRTWFLND